MKNPKIPTSPLIRLLAAALLAAAPAAMAAPESGDQATVTGPPAVSEAPGEPGQPATILTQTPQALPIERMLSEAARQLALLETLGQINALLGQLQAAGPDLLVLLDGDRPQAERLREALSGRFRAAEPAPPTGIDALREEVQVLRTLVEGMGAFGEIPAQPVPEPQPEPDAPDIEWDLARNHVRYVQHPGAGFAGYVALGNGHQDVVVGPGEQATLDGREVFLASIERAPAGRTRLNFLVDRVPAVIEW